MRSAALLALLLLSCRTGDQLVGVAQCGQPCYGGATAQAGVGACSKGVWACGNDGILTCVNWTAPAEEVCDGVDNDCDGRVDEFIQDDPHLCKNECGIGVQQCLNGRWTQCSAPKPAEEVCDGRDNDCDGRVDEAEDFPVKYCYSGPGASAAFGVCHPGSTRCVAGREICFGEVVPAEESCNGADDDCDGVVDESGAPTERIDFVLVFDNSGSMVLAADNLKAATQSWVTKYATNVDRRYALVTAPDDDNFISGPHLFRDFTDAAGLAAAVGLQSGQQGSGAEPTLDAIAALIDITNPLRLSWRSGSKRVVVVFTDEEPQSYENGCAGACSPAVTDITNDLVGGGVVVHIFTSTDPSVWNQWRPVSAAGGGRNWDIYASVTELELGLDDLLRTVTCN